MQETPHIVHRTTRRQLLAGLAVGGVAAVAGCLGDSEGTAPDPVGLDGEYACEYCDMQIQMHPGPVGEAFYLDDRPETLPEDREDGIARFCSTWCTYSYVLENAERGPEPVQIYATDYSSVDYTLDDDGGTTVISAHLDAASLADVDDLTYVVDSDVEGAMGASLIGFSTASDAEGFAEEHGGSLLTHDEITLETIQAM